MQLEDYFDFLAPDDIRIKGHRIGIESVLYEYIHRAQTPEEIQQTYPTLTLEEVYATILYYLHNREQVSKYLTDWLEYCHKAEQEAAKNPSPARQRLLRIKAQLDTYPPEERDAALKRILAEERAEKAKVAHAEQPEVV
ncbi:MAG: hypothetical protein A3F84_13380 [Candidatus Handelsmanbacteria bacterium RIFCSPLOWO2_12_FULL_64_10]|uniref:DUF433 domain-containing protein n=1 Tax=Handelsmanbacteria sp. (strain RIFCSPLOWO2_12_FULL_64_10) TaxID=1817868 RepID=A0A1F6C3H1_HANXR|nr:MAG: hypothetical protein A3F84_13380 [Candidatus Handelsmanbacteria bacterium RIFCSPLOWO2_12_FULL_64_10]